MNEFLHIPWGPIVYMVFNMIDYIQSISHLINQTCCRLWHHDWTVAQRYVSRFTKLYNKLHSVLNASCCTSGLLEKEARERHVATSLRLVVTHGTYKL